MSGQEVENLDAIRHREEVDFYLGDPRYADETECEDEHETPDED